MASKTSKAKAKPPLVFRCLPVKQFDQTFYMFAAPAKALWSVVSINQRDENKDSGYQRVLSPSRTRAIAAYLKKQQPMPLSLLISFDDAALSPDKRTITIKNKPKSGWVIDGQHRLAGAHESELDVELPVIAFVGLDVSQQIGQFVTINREAKGVPTSLYYDLLKHLPKKKSAADTAKERAADIANELRKDEESPFFGKIVIMSSPAKGEISLTNFVRKVAPLVFETKGFLAAYSVVEQRGIIHNYYKGLQIAEPKEFDKPDSVFFQTIGFGALMNALPTFVNLTLKATKSFKVKDVVSTFKEIGHFDFAAWRELGTGGAAESQAGDDLTAELLAAFETKGEAGSIALE
jgi:DGQHR domain-containing protein